MFRACRTPTTVKAIDDTLFLGEVQDENDPSPWVTSVVYINTHYYSVIIPLL